MELAAAAWSAIKVVGSYVASAGVKAGMAAGLSKGAALGVTNFAMKVAGLAALTAASASLMQPNIPARNPGEWVADPNAGIPFAISDRIGVAGNIVYKNTYGKNNRYKSLVTVMSGAGPISSVISFTADKRAVSFGSAGAATGHYNGAMWRDLRLGDQPDTALVSPVGDGSSLPGWGPDHKLSGKASFMLTLRGDSKNQMYPGGREPLPLHVLSGIKGYDPRYDSTWPGGSGSVRLNNRSTWLTITNGAIADLNWCLGLRENGKVVGGLGAGLGAIDVEAFIEAANVADLNGWKICAYPRSTDNKAEVRAGLLQAAGALISRRAGLISCITRGAVKAPVATVTVRDTAGPIEIETCANVLNRLNTMTPRYLSEAHDWQMVDAAPVSAPAYVDEDRGRVRSEPHVLPFVSAAKQAAELTALYVANTREGIAGTIPLKPYLREIKPGDAFLIDGPGFVADNLKCLCLQRDYDPGSDVVRITFVSETDGKIAWALGQAASPPPTPSLSAKDPLFLAPPEELEWEVVVRPPGAGGEQQPGFDVNGGTDNANADFVILEIGPAATGPWEVSYEGPPTTEKHSITGLQPGQTYYVAISYRTNGGVYSERLVQGPFTAPALIASDAVNVGGEPALNILGRVATAEDLIAIQGGLINGLQIQISDAEGDFASALVLVGEAVEASEGYASASQGFATVATEQAGIATTVAIQASEARDDSVNASLTSIASAQSGRLTAASLLPSDFVNDGQTWFNGQTGAPASAAPITAAGIYSFPTVTGIGKVLRVVSASTFVDVSAIGAITVQPGRSYRLTARVRATTAANAPAAQLRFAGLDSAYAFVGAATATQALTVNTWTTVTVETTATALIAAGAAYVRPWMRLQGADTFELKSLRLEDITESVSAATSAATAITQAANASASAASANLSFVAAANTGTGLINPNPTFANWPGTDIASLTDWSAWVSNGTFSKVAGTIAGQNSVRLASSSAADHGIINSYTNNASPGGDWVVAEFDFTLVAGDLNGTAFLIYARPAGATTNLVAVQQRFSSIPDASGRVRGAGTVGATYRYRILANMQNASAARYLLYFFARRATLSPVGAATIDLHRAGIRMATPEEIAAGTVIPGLSASVAVNSGAVVDLQTKVEQAFFEVIAAAGGAPAQLAIKAGTGSSTIALAASALILKNIVNGQVIKALELIDGRATFGAPLYIDFNGARLILGPGFGAGTDPEDKLLLWFGADTYDETTATYENSIGGFVIRADLTAPSPSEFSASTNLALASATRTGSEIVTTNSITITVQNALGTVTYSWSKVSGDAAIYATGPSAATTSFSETSGTPLSREATYMWVATDTTTGQFRQGFVQVQIIGSS